MMGRRNIKSIIAKTLLISSVLVFLFSGVGMAQKISQGYRTNDPDLKLGMVVEFNKSADPKESLVERATNEAGNQVIGVTVNPGDNTATIANQKDQVYVQSSGIVLAWGVDINGPIKKGNKLAISPLKGILMNATNSDSVVGIAATEDFAGAQTDTSTIMTDNGQSMVHLAKGYVSLNSNLNTAQQQPVENRSLLQGIAKSIVGKPVSDLQILAAIIIFFILFAVEGNVIHAAVSAGVISLGRNPLAEKAIKKELIKVVLLVLAVLVMGIFIIYFILKI